MAKNSHIGWTDHTWNPWGWVCNKVSAGCKNCYMFALAERWNRPNPATEKPVWRDKAYDELRKMPKQSVVFVNSMSDTYHERVPVHYIENVHLAAESHYDKIFLLLTKRPERALELADRLVWPRNLWIGTSIESEAVMPRLDALLKLPTRNFFVSAEPLLSEIPSLYWYLQCDSSTGNRIGWVIVGGESGKGRRPFDKAWADDIRWMCNEWKVPFFFKQGSAFKSGEDRELDGHTYDETPDWFDYCGEHIKVKIGEDNIPF